MIKLRVCAAPRRVEGTLTNWITLVLDKQTKLYPRKSVLNYTFFYLYIWFSVNNYNIVVYLRFCLFLNPER